jgi:hypothetical protein
MDWRLTVLKHNSVSGGEVAKISLILKKKANKIKTTGTDRIFGVNTHHGHPWAG